MYSLMQECYNYSNISEHQTQKQKQDNRTGREKINEMVISADGVWLGRKKGKYWERGVGGWDMGTGEQCTSQQCSNYRFIANSGFLLVYKNHHIVSKIYINLRIKSWNQVTLGANISALYQVIDFTSILTEGLHLLSGCYELHKVNQSPILLVWNFRPWHCSNNFPTRCDPRIKQYQRMLHETS